MLRSIQRIPSSSRLVLVLAIVAVILLFANAYLLLKLSNFAREDGDSMPDPTLEEVPISHTSLAGRSGEQGHYLIIAQNMKAEIIPCNLRILHFAVELARSSGRSISVLPRGGCMMSGFKQRLLRQGVTPLCYGNNIWHIEDYLMEKRVEAVFLYMWFWQRTTIPESYLNVIRRVSPHTRIVVVTDDSHSTRERLVSHQMDILRVRFAEEKGIEWNPVRPLLEDSSSSQPSGTTTSTSSTSASAPSTPSSASATLITEEMGPKLKQMIESSQSVRASDIAQREALGYQAADLVVAVSDWDVRNIRRAYPALTTPFFTLHWATPLTPNVPLIEQLKPFGQRSGLIFIGNGGNPTNVLALHWFFRHVFPRIQAQLYEIDKSVSITLVGEWREYREEPLAPKGQVPIMIRPYIKENELEDLISQHRLMFTPIVVSTGINTKNFIGISTGTPTITTTTGAKGLDWSGLGQMGQVDWSSDFHRAFAVGDTAESFAAHCLELYRNKTAWTAQSRAGLRYARAQIYSGMFESEVSKLVRVLEKPTSSNSKHIKHLPHGLSLDALRKEEMGFSKGARKMPRG